MILLSADGRHSHSHGNACLFVAILNLQRLMLALTDCAENQASNTNAGEIEIAVSGLFVVVSKRIGHIKLLFCAGSWK